MKKTHKRTVPFYRLSLVGMLCLFLVMPQSAGAAQMCRLPDGFAFNPTHIAAEKETDTGGKGIGGTGIRYAETGKGIGGTGVSFQGGVGIYGRITGFGSICVNGLEVHYSSKTPVKLFGVQAQATQLRVGQVVSVTAFQSARGLMAKTISATGILAGRLAHIDAAANTISVGGRTVAVTNAAALARDFTAGEHVVISGFHTANGSIVASFVAKAPAGYEAPAFAQITQFKDVRHVVLQGYARAGQQGIIDIGHMPVKNAAQVRPNERVIILATVEKDGLHASFIHMEPHEMETELAPFMKDRHADDAVSPERQEQSDAPEKTEPSSPENDRHEEDGPRGMQHGVSTPDMPEEKAPETPSIDIQTPEIQPPEVQTPEIQTPEVQIPEIPQVEAPSPDD